MVEKQASSEIAQSRESIQKLCPAYRQGGTVAAHWCVICQALEQAERDTRERCAQEADDFLTDNGYGVLAQSVTERIRGKE
jgi:hypothetical protein